MPAWGAHHSPPLHHVDHLGTGGSVLCGLAGPAGDHEIGVRADLPAPGVQALQQDPEPSTRVGITEKGELRAPPALELAAGQRCPKRSLLIPQGCGDVQAHLVKHALRVGPSEPVRMLLEGVTEKQAPG